MFLKCWTTSEKQVSTRLRLPTASLVARSLPKMLQNWWSHQVLTLPRISPSCLTNGSIVSSGTLKSQLKNLFILCNVSLFLYKLRKNPRIQIPHFQLSAFPPLYLVVSFLGVLKYLEGWQQAERCVYSFVCGANWIWKLYMLMGVNFAKDCYIPKIYSFIFVYHQIQTLSFDRNLFLLFCYWSLHHSKILFLGWTFERVGYLGAERVVIPSSRIRKYLDTMGLSKGQCRATKKHTSSTSTETCVDPRFTFTPFLAYNQINTF